MLPMDCHTHTGISPDGTGTVAGHAEQAKRLGLPVLALTEHVETARARISASASAPPQATRRPPTAASSRGCPPGGKTGNKKANQNQKHLLQKARRKSKIQSKDR